MKLFTREQIQSVIHYDLNDRKWKYFYLPSIVLLIASYVVAMYKFFGHPGYFPLQLDEEENMLYENHVGNITMLASQPNMFILGFHMFMAMAWACGTIVQKQVLKRMQRDPSSKYYKNLHSIVGHILCFIAMTGLFAGFLIAYNSQSDRSMRNFLLVLPLFICPLVVMTFYSGKRKDILNHRFWANVTFVGVSIGTFYSEVFIFILSRYTPFGVRSGELLGTAIGTVILITFVLVFSLKDAENLNTLTLLIKRQ